MALTTEPTDDELAKLFTEETGFDVDDFPAAILDFARAVLAKWGAPQPDQSVPPAGREPLTEVQIERAAKKLAECMDYPWGHMPTIGREEMRIHARAVLEAARLEKAP